MAPLVSIVVPVYKVEAFLDRCVNSLVTQSYTNIEIILVDDGSPDNCGAICDAWALRDARIRVLHKENGGLSDARNYGTALANGEFVTYVDSDDYVADCFVERFVTLQQQHEADVVCCDFVETSEDRTQFEFSSVVEVYDNRQACLVLMGRRYMPLVVAWCKMYRREIVVNNPFPKGKIHEDEATTCKFLWSAKKVILCEDKLYAYYQNPNSITKDGKTSNYQARLWGLSERAEYFDGISETALANVAWSQCVRFLINQALLGNNSLREIVYPFIREHKLQRRLDMKTWIKLLGSGIMPNAIAKHIRKTGSGVQQ